MNKKRLSWENSPETLTVSQAAELVGTPAQSIRNWIHAGDLSAKRTSGGHFRIDRRVLQHFWRETKHVLRPTGDQPTREKAAEVGRLACRIIGALEVGDLDRARQTAWEILDLARIIQSETTPL
jgi:excisionase family DNA binding protein